MLLRFAGALGWHWATWHDQEGITWMTAILAAARPSATAEFGRALLASAFVNSYAPSPLTRAQAVESVELLERCGDRSSAGRARLILSFIELMLGGDPTFAKQQINLAERGLAKIEDQWGQAFVALSRFRLHLHTGSVTLGVEAGREALNRFQTLGDSWGIPWTTWWLGSATRMVGNTDEAKRLFIEAIAVSEDLEYVRCCAHGELGNLAALDGDHQLASWHHDKCAELAPTTGVPDSIAMAANAAGVAARIRGDAEAARRSHLQALAIYQELGSDIGKAQTTCSLAYAELHLRQHSTAAHGFRTALKLAERIGRPDIMMVALEGLASIGASRDAQTSALLLGSARRIRQDTGIQLTFVEGHDAAETEARLRSVLGESAFQAAIMKGRQSSERIIGLYLL
jgi:tetratricopeptide (TPR) repeat protein